MGASLVKKADGDVKFPELSHEFIGCAMAVHRELGPGQNESFYHLALSEAMKSKGMAFPRPFVAALNSLGDSAGLVRARDATPPARQGETG